MGRIRLLLTVSGLVGILCFVAAGASAEPAGKTLAVRGTVVDDAGRPIADARISCVHQPLHADYVVKEGTTDAQGRFEFADVPVPERVMFLVRREGFAMGLVHQIFTDDRQTEPLSIVLRPPGRFRLHVTDPSQAPLSGAVVDLVEWDGGNGPARLERRLAQRLGFPWPQSDDAGRIEFSSLPAGARASGRVTHALFARAPFSVKVAAENPESHLVKLAEAVKLTLRIVGRGGAVPATGLHLTLFRRGDDDHYFWDEPIALDANNEFHAAIPPGTYGVLMLHAQDVQPLPALHRGLEVRSGQPARFEIAVTPRGIITGRVLHRSSGKPIPNIMVEACVHAEGDTADPYRLGPGWYYSAQATTDEQGRYEIRPGVGNVRLFLFDPENRYLNEDPFLTVSNVREKGPVAGSDVHLVDCPTLRGVVVDSAGRPVPKAVLQPTGQQQHNRPSVCDAQGRFEYRVEAITRDRVTDPTGHIELSVFDPFRPLGQTLKVALDPRKPTDELTIRLEPQPIPPSPEATGRNDGKRSLIGQAAPELAFATSFEAGTMPLRLADHHGKFVLLHFWATWCGPCRYDMPRIELAHDLYSDKGLVVIGVHHNSVPADAVGEFIRQNGPRHPTGLDTTDGKTCERYGVEGFPTHVLIGPDGRIVLTDTEDRIAMWADLIATLRRFLNAAGQLETP